MKIKSQIMVLIFVASVLVPFVNAIPEIAQSGDPDTNGNIMTTIPELDMTGMYTDINLVEVDPEIMNATPDWIVLAHDDEGRAALLNDINNSPAPDAEKSEIKSTVLDLWARYPVRFENIGEKSIEIYEQSTGLNKIIPIGRVTRISFDHGEIDRARSLKNENFSTETISMDSSQPIILTVSENRTIENITKFRVMRYSEDPHQENVSPENDESIWYFEKEISHSGDGDYRVTFLGPGIMAWAGGIIDGISDPSKYYGHEALIYWACKNQNFTSPLIDTTASAGMAPDLWSPANPPRILPPHDLFLHPVPLYQDYYDRVVHSYDHYYNPDRSYFFPGNAPTFANDYARIAQNHFTANSSDPDAAVTLGWASHFLSDISNPMHTGRELEQIYDALRTPYDTHATYEDFVTAYANQPLPYPDEFSGNYFTYNELSRNDERIAYRITDPETATINLATFSHAYLDTLYYRVQNLPPEKDTQGHVINGTGFHGDRTVNRITYNCLKAASRYNAGLVDFVMNKPLTAEIPIADFTATPNPVCGSSYEVAFSDKTHLTYKNTTDNMYISWDFGDGGKNNGSTYIVHPYDHNTPGTYRVKLTTWNSFGSTNKTMDIIVGNCTPFADFYVEYQQGFFIKYTDTSSYSPSSWRWDFGDGNISVDRSPLHQYANDHEYTVTLIASNVYGSGTASKIISPVSNYPKARFIGAPTDGVSPTKVQFNSSSVGSNLNYLWNFGDGDSTNNTQESPLHSYNSPGTFTVKLTVTNSSGNSDTQEKPGYIHISAPDPHADFSAEPITHFDGAPVDVTFTDTSTNDPDRWAWNFGDGDGTNATDQNPVHTYLANGTYSVALTATNSVTASNTTVKTNYITVGPIYATTNGVYTILKFNKTGSTKWIPPAGVTAVDYLVVGGGGSGSPLK